MARSPNKGIVQICLILTGICCFIFWIVTFIAQLNPLIGPQLHTGLIRWILIEWYGGKLDTLGETRVNYSSNQCFLLTVVKRYLTFVLVVFFSFNLTF
ncbi:V-type proton ATPase subunit e [Bulinus truncatus]|nr:V-type proton ATPase subunit e [Bulinus truncatus]